MRYNYMGLKVFTICVVFLVLIGILSSIGINNVTENSVLITENSLMDFQKKRLK